MTSDSLKQRVLEAARGSPSPPRSARLPHCLRRGAMLLLAASAMSAAICLVGSPASAAERPLASSAWILAGTALLAAVTTGLALPPARSMLSRSRSQLLAAIVGAPVLIGLWLVLWHGTYPDPYQRFGWRCFGLTLVTAPLPFALLGARRFHHVRPGFSGAALGAASGAWAAVMVELWCPLSSAGHVAFGHVLPLALLVAFGASAGSHLFGARRSAARRPQHAWGETP